jgi:ribosome-associated translation inhibitor RaiA
MLDFDGPKAVVEVSHAGRINDYDRPKLDAYLKSFVGRYEKIVHIERLKINVKVHNDHPRGGRKKYSMHATLYSNGSVFRSTNYGWDVFQVADDMMQTLRKQILKIKSRERSIVRIAVRRTKN